MSSIALNELDASAAARQLQRREISAEQLVRACLDRIDAREPAVQAWTYIAADASLAHARELDRGPIRGLLHGLPIGVKDLFDSATIGEACSPIGCNRSRSSAPKVWKVADRHTDDAEKE